MKVSVLSAKFYNHRPAVEQYECIKDECTCVLKHSYLRIEVPPIIPARLTRIIERLYQMETVESVVYLQQEREEDEC